MVDFTEMYRWTRENMPYWHRYADLYPSNRPPSEPYRATPRDKVVGAILICALLAVFAGALIAIWYSGPGATP